MDGEQYCPACNRSVLVLRKPRYEGFTRVGEDLTCAVCGLVLEAPGGEAAATSPAANPSRDKLSALLGEEVPDAPVLSDDGSAHRLCHRCRHYTVNPFRQWCGLHRTEVEATDSCPQFSARPEPDGGDHA